MACVLGLCAGPAGAVIPAPALPAVGPLPAVTVEPPAPILDRVPLPDTAIERVERAATAPAQPGQPSAAEPTAAPRTAAAPTDPAPAAPGAESSPPKSRDVSDQRSASADARAPAGPEREESTPAAKAGDPAAETSPQATAPSEPLTAPGRASVPTVVERIVAVVPLPLKVALAVLLALLVAAVGAALRTGRRLARAERSAATDALTGLPNRRHANEVVERLLCAARRSGRPLALVLFDLDHFKSINDRFGHGTGDDALRAVADVTRGLLRGSDHVARFGGEEFVLLLPETGAGDAAIVAEKVRARIDGLEIAGLGAGITASFGVAVHPDHGLGADQLFAAADAALYEAKEKGRDRVAVSGGRRLEAVAAGGRAA